MDEVENSKAEEQQPEVDSKVETTDNLTENEVEPTTETVAEEEKEPKEKGKSFFGKKNKDDKLKSQIETLQTEKAELNDKFLRLFSEFDNYKKRTAREKLDLIGTASEQVIVSLLPVIDDFERAIEANKKVDNLDSVKEGFELIYQKLLQVLKRFSVEEIPAKGEKFDTDFHEAITHFPAQNEEDKGKVVDVTEKGYKMKDKVIRYSKVVVAN